MHWPISGPKQGPLSSMIGLKLAFVKNIRTYNYYSYYLRIKYCASTYLLVQVVLFQKHSFKSEKNQGKPKVIYQFDHPRREFEPSGAICVLNM